MIRTDRLTAHLEGEFVVFLIGMRVNRPWKIHKWLPVVLAMPRMIKELLSKPDFGLLALVRGELHERGGQVKRVFTKIPVDNG